MYHVINSQTNLQLITLEQAKAQSNIMQTIDDTLINEYIYSASDIAQSYCNRMLSVGSVSMSLEHYKSCFQLWGGEVKEIESITAEDSSGQRITISDYKFNYINQKISLGLSNVYYFDFIITYNAGYVAAPKKIEQAVKLMVATFYNNREDNVVGLSVERMPITSLKLLDSVKHYAS